MLLHRTSALSVSNDEAGPLKIVQGEFDIGSQYHFHLEPQSCLVRPVEDGQYEIISATQTVYKVQATVAKALAMPENAFDLRCSKDSYYICTRFESSNPPFQGETPRRRLRREDQPAQPGGLRMRGGLLQDGARRAPRARPQDQHGAHGQETALHGQGRNIEHLG